MNIFNPVIGNDKPNCRCKDCFHGFWLRNLHDSKLKCYCELSHSIIFSAGLEKVAVCSGAEDNLDFSDFRKENIACTHCLNSLWYKTDKNISRCFCLHLQCFVYDFSNKKLYQLRNVTAFNLFKNFLLFQLPPTLTIFKEFYYGF